MLELGARDLEANFNEVIKCFRVLDSHVFEGIGQTFDFFGEFLLCFFLLDEQCFLFLLLALHARFEQVSHLSVVLQLSLFLQQLLVERVFKGKRKCAESTLVKVVCFALSAHQINVVSVFLLGFFS